MGITCITLKYLHEFLQHSLTQQLARGGVAARARAPLPPNHLVRPTARDRGGVSVCSAVSQPVICV